MKFKKANISPRFSEIGQTSPEDLGVYQKLSTKKRHCFVLEKSVDCLEILLKKELINSQNCLKIISYSGGYSSISFIKVVAEREPIEELICSTLRVGEKQLGVLDDLEFQGKIKNAKFVIGGIMKSDSGGKYDYYSAFQRVCQKNGWEYCISNNHSKIILMRTEKHHYVLETSSNLNENPKIEQFSFEDSEELFCFYRSFFKKVMEVSKIESEGL